MRALYRETDAISPSRALLRHVTSQAKRALTFACCWTFVVLCGAATRNHTENAMSFKNNAGKPAERALAGQCEMLDSSNNHDIACLEPAVGTVAEACGTRVCAGCAVQMEKESFVVSYYGEVRFVLAHPGMGVYLGFTHRDDRHLWSKIEPDQPAAVTFKDRVAADSAMRSWDSGRPDKVIIWPVVPDFAVLAGDKPTYASIAACVAAGLEAWDPNAKPAT